MWAAVIGGIAGLCTGVMGSLVAPCVVSRIKREESVRTQREARVAEWRGGLAGAEREGRIESRECLHDSWYLSLRRHLPAETVAAVEHHERITAVGPHVDTPIRSRLGGKLVSAIDSLTEGWDVV